MLSHSLLKPRVGLSCERPRLTKGLAQPRLPAQRRPALRAAPVQAAATGSDNANEFKPSARDLELEAGRKKMRDVFDVDRWVVHRSQSRYFRHLLALPQSRVVSGLLKPLVYVMGMAAALCAYETWRARLAAMLATSLPAIDLKVKEFFGMTSFALALLLVFRTNASYARWDEARKFFGVVLNRSRDLVRLGLTWVAEDKSELRAMLFRWVPAFSRTLMCHVRGGQDLAKELEGVLQPDEIAAVMQAQHRPNYVLQVLSEIVGKAATPNAATLKMEEDITAFEDCVGGCERILRTPIPLFYTRHTSRFLMVWLSLLPFALQPTCGWVTVPLSGIIAFLLLGIDKIGVSIEEPFSVLALETICGTILTNVRELVATNDPAAAGSNGAAAQGVSAAQLVAAALSPRAAAAAAAERPLATNGVGSRPSGGSARLAN